MEEMSWKLPDPPDEEVDVVCDSTGRTFFRMNAAGEYWISNGLGPGRGTYAWHELLFQRGEVVADGELRDS